MVREYTYGPYPSRRLGLSLGVDILPKVKTCTFDCVYCEIGKTRNLVRNNFRLTNPPSRNFRKELKEIFNLFPHLDSITFGYNGEPTLNENLVDFYRIVNEVRNDSKWVKKVPPITLFTNSTTLDSVEIRKIISKFDVILAKLDAATEEDYQRTNRPHFQVPKINQIIDNLAKLSREIESKSLILQILIYSSYKKEFIANHNEKNLKQLALAIKKIKPEEVQIYSIGRIPSEFYVYSIDSEIKKRISLIFKEYLLDESINIKYY